MDEISKAIKGARAAQVGRIYGSFSNAQQVSSDDDSIRKSEDADEIIKGGKRALVGEIRTWNGKKYKKQANGKWLEVSEYGMTKKEHENVTISIQSKLGSQTSSKVISSKEGIRTHSKAASGLSDKEYSDEEVGLNKNYYSDTLKLDLDVPGYRETIVISTKSDIEIFNNVFHNNVRYFENALYDLGNSLNPTAVELYFRSQRKNNSDNK